jgi:hypothetical protein
VHLILDFVYRPWAVANAIFDLGFKYSFSQITSVIGISLLIFLIEKDSNWKTWYGKAFLVIVPVMAMILYEFIQMYLEYSTFDPNDLWYTLMGEFGAYIIYFHILNDSSSKSESES